MTPGLAAALALSLLAADPGLASDPGAPSGAASAAVPRRAEWTIRIELGLGGVGYDGVSGPVPGGGGVAVDGGVHVRRGVLEGGVSTGMVVGGPFSGVAQRFVGGALGVSVPFGAAGPRSAWRAELLAEGGADKVSGAGLGPDSGVVGAPPVTLPYAGVRAGISGRIRAGDARVVLGAWWIERHDLGRRDTVIEEGADRGDRYRIGGVTRGLLLRAGLELSL